MSVTLVVVIEHVHFFVTFDAVLEIGRHHENPTRESKKNESAQIKVLLNEF